MNPSWQKAREDTAQSGARRFRASRRDATLRERLDLILIGLALAGIIAAALGGSIAAGVFDRNAILDPEVLRPFPDERILQNMHYNSSTIVGQTQMPDGDIVVLRKDGHMARIDMRTDLVSDDDMPMGDDGLSTPTAVMSASCAPDVPCDDSDAVHVLSEGGGVMRGDAGGAGRFNWSVLLHDAPWIGASGRAVEHADVTSWAANASGSRVAVLAGAEGMALLDTASGRWLVPNGQSALLSAVDAGQTWLVPDGDRFWVASSSGYGLVTQDQLQWSQSKQIALRDLTISPSGDRMAVIQGPCQIGAAPDCVTLSELVRLNELRPIVGENQRIPDLDQAGLSYAMLQKDTIVTVGAAGVHSYDPATRSWKVLVSGRIDAFHAGADERLVVSSGSTVYIVANARVSVTRENVNGAPFRQLALGGKLAVGLGEDGVLRDLDTGQVLRGEEDRMPEGTAFETGAAQGNLVLMSGPNGVLLHDVSARHFDFLPPQALQSALPLLDPGNRIVGLGPGFGLVNSIKGAIYSVEIEGDFLNHSIATTQIGKVNGPLRSLSVSGSTIWLVDAQGVPWRAVSGAGPVPLVGPRLQGGDPGFRLATSNGSEVIFASGRNILNYDPVERSWVGSWQAPSPTPLIDMTLWNHLFVASQSGAVHQLKADGTSWRSTLLGGSAAVGLSSLSDAAPRGNRVLLAGSGAIQEYDPNGGGFARGFSGGAGAVRIVDPSPSGVPPVWVSGGKLLQGSTEIINANVRDAWKVSDGYLVELSDGRNGGFTAHLTNLDGAPTCTFRTAPAPAGTVRDGAELDQNRVLIATDKGWGIHDAIDRRWLEVRGPRLEANERLILTPNHIVLLSPSGFRTIQRAMLTSPDGCAPPVIELGEFDENLGQSAVYDPATGAITLLLPNGVVTQWKDGVSRTLLSATSKAPATDSLRAMKASGTSVLFATSDALWHYNIATRTWRRVPFEVPQGNSNASVASVSIVTATSDRATISVWLQNGVSLAGQYTDGDTSFALQRLNPVSLPQIPVPARDILDMSQRDDLWAVGTQNAIAFGRGTDASLESVMTLDGRQSPTPYDWNGHLTLLSGDPTAPTALWIMPKPRELARLAGSVADHAFSYTPGTDRGYGLDLQNQTLWRISADGNVLTCTIVAGASATTGCTQDLGQPYAISQSALERAWSRGSLSPTVYISNQGQLVRLDDDLRESLTYVGPTITDATILTRVGDYLLLLEKPNGVLWKITSTEAMRLADGVRDLVNIINTTYFETAAGVQVMKRDGTTAPLTSNPNQRAVTLDWFDKSGPYAVEADGRLASGETVPLQNLPLPHPETISAVIPQGDRAVWAQRTNGVIDYLTVAQCDVGPHVGAQRKCLASDLPRPVGSGDFGRLLGVAVEQGQSKLYLERGTIVLSRDGERLPDQPARDRLTTVRQLPDVTEDTRAKIVSTAQNGDELAPPIVNGNTLAKPNVRVSLATSPQPWNPLNIGWMSWQRDTHRVSFAGINQQLILPPAEAIREGQFLPTRAGRALPLGPQGTGHVWLTPEALWTYTAGSKTPLFVTFHDKPLPTGQGVGRFLFPDGTGMTAADGAILADTDILSINADDLSLTAQLRGQSVSGTLSRLAGTPVDAFAESGFFHDQRRTLTVLDSKPTLITPAGFVSINGPLVASEVLPGTQPPSYAPVLANTTYVVPNGTWSQRQGPGQWVAAANPFVPRQIASAAGRNWTMTAQGLTIEAQETWRVQRSGLAFDTDRFISVAATPDHVALLTGLGTHDLRSPPDLRVPNAPTDGPANAPLEALAATPGQPLIYDSSGTRRMWDATNGRWTTAQLAPWSSRLAAETPALKITLDRGSFVAERAVMDAAAKARWASFSWAQDGQLPFDKARVIHATATDLWIGTEFGLRRFGPNGEATATLIDVGTGTGSVSAINRIGPPATLPSTPMVRAASGACFELTPGQLGGSCPSGEDLSQRYVVSTALWNWIETDRGPEGSYPIVGGASRPSRLSPQGAWPHDDLLGWAACGQGPVEIWSDGQILRDDAASRQLPVGRVTGVLCQEKSVPLAGGQIFVAGRYLAGAEPLTENTPGTWVRTSATDGAEVNRWFNGDVSFASDRIRLDVGTADGAWRHLTMAGDWRALAWQDGLPALDQTEAFFLFGSEAIRVTPAGLVSENWHPDGLFVDPKTLVLGVADQFNSLADCRASRLERADGLTYAIPALADAPINLQCRDGRQFVSQGGKRDIGALVAAPDDLFATRSLIENATWSWTLTQATPNAPFALSTKFKDEPMRVASGRFAMDDFISIAAPFNGVVDLVSLDGWRQQSGTDFGAFAANRPDIVDVERAKTATALSIDRGEDNAPRLCVQFLDGGILLTAKDPDRKVDICARWQGRDPYWFYRDSLNGPPEASAFAANGPLMSRVINAGRFSDLVAIGAPRPFGDGLIVPTTIGAMSMARDGTLRAYYRLEDMRGLLIDASDTAVAVRGDALEPLIPTSDALLDCPALASLLTDRSDLSLPVLVRKGDVVKASVAGQRDSTRAITVDCAADVVEQLREDTVTTDRARYDAQLRNLPEPTGQLRLQVNESGKLYLSDARNRFVPLETPGELGDLLGLYPAPEGRTMAAIFEGDVLQLDVDAAISLLASAEITPSTPIDTTPEPVATPDTPATTVEEPEAVVRPELPATPETKPKPIYDPEIPFTSMTSKEITEIQSALFQRGHYQMRVDGISGPGTKRAVQSFQTEIGVEPTGILTRSQKNILITMSAG